jgi:hypothetical protein
LQAIKYLRQIEKYNRLIENKAVEREQLRSIAYGITAKSDGERVQSSGNQQKMATAIERMVDLERQIESFEAAKAEIIGTIEQLEAIEYDILHKVYVQGYELKEIDIKGYSYSWVKKKHREAISHVQRILDDRVSLSVPECP